MIDGVIERVGGKTYVDRRCPGCLERRHLLLSFSEKTERLFCESCCLHWDRDRGPDFVVVGEEGD